MLGHTILGWILFVVFELGIAYGTHWFLRRNSDMAKPLWITVLVVAIAIIGITAIVFLRVPLEVS